MTVSAVSRAQYLVDVAKDYVRECERYVTFAKTTREVKQYSEDLIEARGELAEAYAALATAQKAARVMGSSAVAGWGLQVASAGLRRAFPTEVSYGAPIAAAFAVQNAAQAGLFGAGALSGLGSALDGAASSMGGSYGGTSAPSYGGSPAYAAAYGDSGAVGRGSSSYGGSPAFEALYGDSRPSRAQIAQLGASFAAISGELKQQIARQKAEDQEQARADAKAERQAAAEAQAPERARAAAAARAQKREQKAQEQERAADIARGKAEAQEQARASKQARVDAKAQRQAEAEAARAEERAPAPTESTEEKRTRLLMSLRTMRPTGVHYTSTPW